jgi:hypothetical protein
MANAYAELPAALQAKLEQGSASAPYFYWLSAVVDQYGLAEGEVAAFFARLGLPLITVDGRQAVLVYKPNVYRHPRNGKRSLQVNLSEEIDDFHEQFHRRMRPLYTGWRWTLHRLAWRYGFVHRLWATVAFLKQVLGDRKLSAARWRQFFKEARAMRRRHRPDVPEPERPRMAGLLDEDDVQALATSVRKHLSAFSWRRGDILVFDNLQVLHGGLPGFGPRELRVLLFNPIPYQHPIRSATMAVPADVQAETIHALLQRHVTSLREAS